MKHSSSSAFLNLGRSATAPEASGQCHLRNTCVCQWENNACTNSDTLRGCEGQRDLGTLIFQLSDDLWDLPVTLFSSRCFMYRSPRARNTLSWPLCPSVSGLPIGKSSSRITPDVKNFILVWMPINGFKIVLLIITYFLQTHLFFHCIIRSLSLALKNKVCNFSFWHWKSKFIFQVNFLAQLLKQRFMFS